MVGTQGLLTTRLCETLSAQGDDVIQLPLEVPDDPPPVPDEVDLVIHLSDGPYAERAPANGLTSSTLRTLHALRVARDNHARLVIASMPSNEHRVATDEALSEGYRRAQDVDAVLVRVGEHVGPGMAVDGPGVVAGLLHDALGDQPLVVAVDDTRSHRILFVDDVVDGLLTVAGSDATGPFRLEHPDAVSGTDLALAVAAAAQTSCRIDFAPRSATGPTPRAEAAPGPDLLGWTPKVDLREALSRTVGAPRLASIDIA